MLTRVLLGDAEVIVRDGLKLLLRRHGYRVVAEAGDGPAAVRGARQYKPNLAVLGSIGGMNGFETAREIIRVSPRTRVVFLTSLGTEERVRQALRGGVSGFVLKTQPADDLFRAMQEVNKGGIYVAPGLAAALLTAVGEAARKPITGRGRQVLELVAEGTTTKEIANLLGISVKTAGFHRARVMKNLDIHDTAGLVRYAVRHGLITP